MARRASVAATLVLVATFVPSARAAADAATARCKIDIVATLPVTMEGLKATVPVTVNGVSAHFTVSSSDFFGTIPPSNVSELGLKVDRPRDGLTVSRDRVPVSVAKVKTFGVAGLELHGVEFLVVGSQGVNDRGETIGANILGYRDAEYDLAGRVIRLVQPHDCGARSLAYWDETHSYSMLDIGPVEGWESQIVGYVTVNGVWLKAAFDTGASTSGLLLGAARRAGIDVAAPGVVDGGFNRGLGPRTFRTWITPVDSIKIGDEELRHTHLRVFDDVNGAVDMVLGMDFFLSHHIYVANSQHRLYFTYNGGAVFNPTPFAAAPSAAPIEKPAATSHGIGP